MSLLDLPRKLRTCRLLCVERLCDCAGLGKLLGGGKLFGCWFWGVLIRFLYLSLFCDPALELQATTCRSQASASISLIVLVVAAQRITWAVVWDQEQQLDVSHTT